MTTVSFPDWSDALKSANLPKRERERHRIIINWFLGHLKRESSPATKTSARDFVEHLVATRRPEEWQVKQWTDGLNWFFREAPTRRNVARAAVVGKARTAGRLGKDPEAVGDGATGSELSGPARVETALDAPGGGPERGGNCADGRQHYAHTVAELQQQVPIDPWYEETVRLMRVRHMALRTEETYLGWIRRRERFLGSRNGLEDFDEGALKRFLTYLAVEEGISARTQRQALNAGVFFLREVRKFELGDFSDYVKADPRKYYTETAHGSGGRSGDSQALELACAPAQLCHPPAGERNQYPHGAGAFGSYLHRDDHDLSPCDGRREGSHFESPRRPILITPNS